MSQAYTCMQYTLYSDRHVVSMEDEQKVALSLSNGDAADDLGIALVDFYLSTTTDFCGFWARFLSLERAKIGTSYSV